MHFTKRQMMFAAAAALIGFTSAAEAASVKIHGSTTVFANLFKDHQGAVEEASGQSLQIVANGSSRGLTDLSSGQADLGMISAPLDATISKMQKKDPSFSGDDLVAHPIGEAKVAFITHPSNPVKTLTREQLTAVFSGEITSWADLGGAPMPIKVVLETSGGGVRTLTEKELLAKESVAADMVEVPNATQISQIVSQMPPALGIAAQAAIGGHSVQSIDGYEALTQPLFLITRGQPSADKEAIIEAARAILR